MIKQTVSAKNLIKESQSKDQKIKQLTEQLNKERRNATMSTLLSNLEAGVKREQMSIILENVATEKLEETYNEFLPKILTESSTKSINNNKSTSPLHSLFEEKNRIVTGNNKTNTTADSDDIVNRMLKNAGIQ